MRPALIRQHGETGPPGLLAEWARARAIPIEIQRTDLDPSPDVDLHDRPFVASLGSKHSPNDSDVPAVAAELTLLERAVAQDVPVLGLCYGAQVLAAVLGGTVEVAPEAELGWHRISSDNPSVVPEGPWLEWHYHRFTLPPQAHELARTARAVQAFTHGRHLAVQFHPESTIEIVKSWARKDQPRLTELGIADGEALAESGRAHAETARANAFTLFDAFWRRSYPAERRAL